MTTFIATIQLQQADNKDYQVLDKEMKKENFITGKVGTGIRLAEFSYRGATSIQHVINAVLRAAEKTGKKFSFTVMKEKLESRNRLQHA